MIQNLSGRAVLNPPQEVFTDMELGKKYDPISTKYTPDAFIAYLNEQQEYCSNLFTAYNRTHSVVIKLWTDFKSTFRSQTLRNRSRPMLTEGTDFLVNL